MVEHALGIQLDLDDPVQAGRAAVRAHNDWCMQVSAIDPRLRPAATIDPTTLSGAIAETERVIAGGVRGVRLPGGFPIGNRSPAHPDNDRFWSLLAEANVPLLLHVGGEAGFLSSTAWTNAPQFSPNKSDSAELLNDPYTLSVNHYAVQNYLTGLIIGGVFERHPTLRVGCIEVTAHWVGPMAENIEMFLDRFPKRMAGRLSLSPREYLERNVRVSAMFWEPVDKYIDRFGLETVYCYGSDYPHVESGPIDPVPVWGDRLARLGPSTAERFFVTNGELLFP
jgi:predicted TIM-barrel fold metal-dependent hydrolase